IRRRSARAIRNRGALALPLPEVIKAPRSTARAVMMPSKGAVSCWKDRSAVSRCTLACCAVTVVRAAATSASATLTLARVASTVAWAAATLACPTSPVKVILPLSICYTPGLRHRLSGGGHHAGQSVRTFCGEKSPFRDGAWHAGTRLGSGATRCLVCPDRPEAVHPHRVVFDCL